MSLAKYKKMRRFNETPEPEGKVGKSGKKLQFVIQKHHATALHYDLRLEMDGVMKSWAVPKGPQLDPKVKRLAMMTEDHPIDYNKFEGVIPEGNYGAGKVIIWDRGWVENDQQQPDWPASLPEGLKKGEVKFILHGQKLHGSYALIKTPHMGDNAWLLIKHRDKYASSKDITKTEPNSVVSGKDVEEIGGSDMPGLKDAPKAKIPRGVKPMLATLVAEPFDNDDWLFEIKWDGYRAIATWDGKKPELYSRNGLDFSKKYPEVVEAVRDLKTPVVLDGEIIAVDADGRAHFEWLQHWGHEQKGQLVYYVFDVLWADGHDLQGLPLLERKAILKKLLPGKSLIKFSDHIKGQGKAFYKTAEREHIEGIMAKEANSPYLQGQRGRHWLKIKTHLRQEFVVGGWTEPKGSRKFIGSLLLGAYEKGKLIYVGNSGGSFGGEQPAELLKKLNKLSIKQPEFEAIPRSIEKTAHWVKPQLVCEVAFAEWTGDGHLRQPVIVGWRLDKSAKNVHIEKPKAVMA